MGGVKMGVRLVDKPAKPELISVGPPAQGFSSDGLTITERYPSEGPGVHE